MIGIFAKLCALGGEVGTVTSAMMYDSGFMTITGETKEGKHFTITINVEEEKNDGKSV